MSPTVSSLQQTVVWIAIPNGRNPETGVYRVSALAYPRLYLSESSTTLASFPDVAMWAARSQSVNFQLNFGGSIVGARRVSRMPDIPFWTALFPDTLSVEPCPATEEILDRRTLSYPLHHILAYLKGKYQEVGREWPWEPPLAEALIRKFDDIARSMVPNDQTAPILADVWNDFRKREWVDDAYYAPDETPHANGWTNKEKDWLLTRLAFRTPNVTNPNTEPAMEDFNAEDDNAVAPEELPKAEFHSMLAAVGQYPELLRIFGLLVDLEASKPPTIPGDANKLWIQVLPSWSPNQKVKSADVSPKTYYDDVTSFRARPRDRALDASPPPTEVGPKNNPERIVGGHIDLKDPRSGISQVDVESALLQLQSLVEDLPYRAGTRVSLPPLASGGIAATRESPAERWVEQNNLINARVVPLGPIPTAADLATLELFAEDVLAGYRLDVGSPLASRWLSLHQRQTTYYFARKSKDDSVVMQDEGWVTPALNVVGDVLVKPNLFAFNTMSPAIGRWTGWSLSVPQRMAPATAVDPTFMFSVSHAIVPGTLPMLRYGVIYRLRVRTVDSAGLGPALDPTYDPAAPYISPELVYRRFEPIAPPVVVTDGILTYDTTLGRNVEKPILPAGEGVLRMVVRDNQPTVDCVRYIGPSLGTVTQSETHGLFDTPTGLDPAARDAAALLEEAAVPSIVQSGTLLISYLPDFLSRGTVFHGLPGADRPWKVDFGTEWPQRQSFRLRMLGGTGGPEYDAATRVLTVYVPPSETVRVKMASYFAGETPEEEEKGLSILGMWAWLKDELAVDSAQYKQLRQGVVDGRHWMFTPSKEMVLVHAVQRPLTSPDFVTLGAKRALNDTTATFSGVVKVHGKSTKQVAVAIQWTEPTDDLEASGPEWTPGVGHTFDTPVASQNATEQGVEKGFDFRDTKHRRVQCRATATSRFGDYFAIGTPLSRAGLPQSVEVFSTARPAAPKVRYVVPTFGWEKPVASSGSLTSIRWGGGLRVYLDRPWYSTGEGEMLAVVLAETSPLAGPVATGRPVVDERLLPYVTQWGADPLWRARDTYPTPRPENFRAARAMQTGLQLVELADLGGAAPKVAVAGHDVQFDPTRRLWYCDLEVDAGPAYFPFVRLALARYQPASVVGAHLSPVVVADYVQMAPNRIARLTKDAGFVNVAVSGETYSEGYAGLARMEVSFEQRQAAHARSLAEWSAVENSKSVLTRDGPAWIGRVPLPAGYSPGYYRLVIREFEQLMSDTGVIPRLVYADAVVLNL